MIDRRKLSKIPDHLWQEIQKPTKEQLKIIKEWIKASTPFLFVHGGVGTGKTLLTIYIAKKLIEKNRPVLFLSEYELWDIKRRDEIVKEAKDIENLIIDDFPNLETLSDYRLGTLFEIIDHRYKNCKRTIISSNYPLSFSSIEQEKIADRICTGVVCQLTGKSKRKKRNKITNKDNSNILDIDF